MKKRDIIFLIILTLLLINIIVSKKTTEKEIGKIKRVEYSKNKIKITLENKEKDYILFTTGIIDIKVGDKIEIYGKEETYKNKKQIIINKIKKLNTKIRS